MFKQSSISALQQQLTHLETLGNEQLNGLLHQLERQKSKLPIEDHSIINWGISLVRAKMREEEHLMEEINERLKIFRDPQTFVRESGLQGLDLTNPVDKSKFLSLSKDKLIEPIINESYTWQNNEIVREYVPILKKNVQDFCDSQGKGNLAPEIFEKYTEYGNKSAAYFREKGLERAGYYQEFSKEMDKE